jgi:hypothetical protein
MSGCRIHQMPLECFFITFRNLEFRQNIFKKYFNRKSNVTKFTSYNFQNFKYSKESFVNAECTLKSKSKALNKAKKL